MVKLLGKPFLWGFLFGGVVLPLIVTLGLIIPYVEYLKPLIAPGIAASRPFQQMVQEGDLVTVHTTPLFWIAFVGVNGIIYGLLGVFIARLKKSNTRV
jgi:hypothetical protein